MRFDFQCDIPNISIMNFVDNNKKNVICTHNLNTCYNVKQLQCLTVNILQKKLRPCWLHFLFFSFFTKVDFILQSWHLEWYLFLLQITRRSHYNNAWTALLMFDINFDWKMTITKLKASQKSIKYKFKAEQHEHLKRLKWDQVLKRSKHRLPTGRIRRVLIFKFIKLEETVASLVYVNLLNCHLNLSTVNPAVKLAARYTPSWNQLKPLEHTCIQ